MAAIGAVRFANPTSSASFSSPRPPMTAPTVCWVARTARAATCPADGAGPPGVAGALMLAHASRVWPTELDQFVPTPSIALGVFAARFPGDARSSVTPTACWFTAMPTLPIDPPPDGPPPPPMARSVLDRPAKRREMFAQLALPGRVPLRDIEASQALDQACAQINILELRR